MDFHPRESKRQGAWCGGYRNHHIADGTKLLLLLLLSVTLPGLQGTSCSSYLEEVETLFHEFGHALESLFSKNTYNMSYIAWDFVELPSQIMEHWATETELLNIYARHYQTNEPIPAITYR